jgi:hypothetical protein
MSTVLLVHPSTSNNLLTHIAIINETHKEYVAVMISVDSDEQVEVIDECKDRHKFIDYNQSERKKFFT